jgi:class 3 adenylate cyclase/predicted ATPase
MSGLDYGDVMQCPSCTADIPEGSRFCNSCGAALPVRCRECAHSNAAGSRFCANCGARLTSDGLMTRAAAPKPALPVDAAERRQMTVMFCDLVDSTALSARLDPEDLRTVIAAYYREVAAEVQRFGGFIARHLGDGVLVYFGYPAAHEDDAERAVRAGLALISAIRGLKLRTAIALDARVGIATGLVVVDVIGEGAAHEWTVLGDTPNLAARLQTFAEPGTVLIAPSTHRLIGALFECRALGPREIKGLANPVQVWQALRLGNVANRFLTLRAAHTPVVGRVDEIDLLMRRWEQAKTGEGRVVLISGEPGIGKSRLVRALDERIGKESHLQLRYFGSALHQDSAFFPVISQLEHAASINREDSAQKRLDKLVALLEPYSANPRQDVALFAELLAIDGGGRYPPLGLAPRIRMEGTLAALLSQLVGLSAHQPVLMTFEDAHWIDPSSHEAMQQAIERLQTLPILLIVTARPEFQPHWVGLPHVTLQSLNRLSRRERTLMIEHLTHGKPLPEEVMRQIVERTDGVPLFVEELTQTVVESGLLREGADRYVLAIPTTLQASLLARLDRLGAVREIAQEAAAIGRDFAYELLAAISGRSEVELVKGLDQLVASGLVQQRGVTPSASYSFKHALMQDVAYSTLLRTRREALHARIAEAYEQRFRDIIDTRPEMLAHHLAQAGFAERSIGFWLKAARVAIARGAAAEAVAQLRRGLALLGEIPEYDNRRRQELELQITLGNALAAATGYTGTETDAAFRRARELCLEIADTVQLIRVTWGQFTGHFAGGRQRLALEVANELLALSQRLDDAGGRQMGHASVGASLLHLASFAEASAQFERALATDPAHEREWAHLYGQSGRVTALAYMSLASLLLGFPDAARRLAEQSVEEARRLAHPTSLCFAHSIASRVYYLLCDRIALAQHSAAVVRLADEHGLSLWQALGHIYTGWSQAENGAGEGAAMIRNGIARYRAAGAALSLPLYLVSLASVEAAAGHQRAVLELLDEAQAASTAGDEHWVSAEIHRLAGEAMVVGDDNTAGAEREFHAALAVARKQGAKLWELRAATSLARLYRNGDKASVARDDLAMVYRSFREGFSDPDLAQAKAALAALA